MEGIQDEIDHLQRQLTNLAPAFDTALGELLGRDKAIGKARQAISTEGEGRRKADALAKVVSEIRCHFTHVEAKRRKPTDRPKHGISRLTRVEIVPVNGCSVNFAIDAMPGPSFLTVLFHRQYRFGTIQAIRRRKREMFTRKRQAKAPY